MNMESTSHNSSLIPKHGHDLAYWGLLVVACVVFLVMNVLTTLKEDDLAFSLIEGVWQPVDSLLDLFRSHYNHFIDSNGRTANFVAALFCGLLGKTAFNICNTLMFGLMAHLLSLLATGRRSVLALSMFLVMVGTCYPVPGETMLWLDGSCNYMWAITLSLLLAYYLLREHTGELGWGGAVALMLASFVVGSFNEATSFGFFAGWCLYYAFNRHKLNRRVVVALTGYLLGIMLIVASPGAWQRAASGDIVVSLGLTDLLSSRWHIFSEKMWRFYLPVAALFAGIAVWIFKGSRHVWRYVWTYVFVCLALVMFALGVIHERAYAPLVTVSFIIIAAVVDGLLKRWQWARIAAVVVCLGLASFTFARGIKMLEDYKVYDDQVVSEIQSAPRQAVLRERQFDAYSRFIKPMNYKSNDFFGHEVIYCNYYGKENVQFVGDSVYNRFHSGRLLDGAVVLPVETTRPDIICEVLSFPNQDYMAVLLRVDSMPLTPQMARYYMSNPDDAMPPEEQARRRHYGLITNYTPKGFYPLAYQGKYLLIFPQMDTWVSHIAFPISYDAGMEEIVLSPSRGAATSSIIDQ